VNWKKRITYTFYRIQQKAAMTRQESYALATLLSLLLLGTLLKSIQKKTFLFDSDIYAETDSLFEAATIEMKERIRLQDSLIAAEENVASTGGVTVKDILFAGKVNINTASQEELERLPRIGPAMAQRILTYRQTHGPFKKIEDLINIKGIGPKTLERLKDKVTLNSPN